MTTECFNCKGSLVSASELEAGACLKCYPDIIAKLRTANEQLEQARANGKDLDEKVTAAGEALTLYSKLVQAEVDGGTAAVRGAPITDNPFESGTDQNEHWALGWNQQNLANQYGKLRSLMLWTCEHLAHVREIAKGYGQDEISTKLELVFQKVVPYVEKF